MAYNFLAYDHDQAFLLPPDLREWLPADHLAWFILDVVDQLDLHPFLATNRADGMAAPPISPGCCWPGCSGPKPSWRPRLPPASSATSNEWPSWPLPPEPAASDPDPHPTAAAR
jgi:hypothetical protein